MDWRKTMEALPYLIEAMKQCCYVVGFAVGLIVPPLFAILLSQKV